MTRTPIAPDETLVSETVRPTEVQLFRFSAATWNAHRIHFDKPYAESEGYPGVLVQSHLHASWLAAYALRDAGPDAALRRFSWRNRAIAVPGDELTLSGKVTDSRRHDGQLEIDLELSTTNQRGELCVTAAATVVVPEPAVSPDRPVRPAGGSR